MSEDVLHAIENAVLKGNVVVGNSAAGDRARFNCHVVDDIAAGVALLATLGGNELVIKRGTYNPAAAIDIPSDSITISFESGVRVVRPDADHAFTMSGRQDIRFRGLATLDGATKAGVFDLINIEASTFIVIDGLIFDGNINGNGVYAFATAGNLIGVVVKNCRFFSCEKGIYIASTVFPAGGANQNHHIIGCVIDACDEEGVLFEGVNLSFINKVKVVDCGSDTGVSNVLLTSSEGPTACEGILIDELDTQNADQAGIELDAAQKCSLVKVYAAVNGTDGIFINDDNNIVSASICTLNTDDGIEITANGDSNIIVGNQLSGNSGTNLVDGGTNTNTGHNIIA